MHFLVIDSDELKETSRLPDLGQYTECSNLEALTGADFAITFLPLPITESTLETHIKSKALFIQRKSAYDILSFDGLKTSIARMKESGIPQQQCILLFIGRDWQDDSGLLRVENFKPFGDVTYQTFMKLKAKWRARGGVVDWLNNESQLADWIQAQADVISNLKSIIEIYPTSQKVYEETESVWETATEIPKDDMRYFLVAGLHGFGPKLAANVLETIQEQQPHLSAYGIYFLKALTDETETGKSKYNIRGWGEKSRKSLRKILGLPTGWNLTVKEIVTDEASLAHGWYGALRAFKQLLTENMNPKEAWECLMRQADEFYKEDGIT